MRRTPRRRSRGCCPPGASVGWHHGDGNHGGARERPASVRRRLRRRRRAGRGHRDANHRAPRPCQGHACPGRRATAGHRPGLRAARLRGGGGVGGTHAGLADADHRPAGGAVVPVHPLFLVPRVVPGRAGPVARARAPAPHRRPPGQWRSVYRWLAGQSAGGPGAVRVQSPVSQRLPGVQWGLEPGPAAWVGSPSDEVRVLLRGVLPSQ
mmetsp:Transcript_131059/g.298369  ORF Transcript_131059/g.298369 Transcript_131059/m.298369 type:complete len:209 (+) Transcript_131059:436-1062(+)